MHRLILILLFAGAAAPAQMVPVPAQYQELYTTLSTQISAFDTAVHASWNGTSSPVIYAPQLEAASAAQYTTLLNANYYTNAVLPELEELQALGAQGVDVHITAAQLIDIRASIREGQCKFKHRIRAGLLEVIAGYRHRVELRHTRRQIVNEIRRNAH